MQIMMDLQGDFLSKRSGNNDADEIDDTNVRRRQVAHDSGYADNDSTNNGYDTKTDIDDYSPTKNTNYENGHDSARKHQQSDEPEQVDEPEQIRKLFIGGLDYKTSEDTLRQHFEKFGDVKDCVVMREPQSKRSRGFGFVIYASPSMVDRAQEARPHVVDGREVQSKRAISREDSGRPEAQATVKKVYLGGLSDDIEESELRDYFNEFGNIVNINIVAHKDTGKRRGFAFVEYDDYDPVDKIVLKKHHKIKDKSFEAKKAIPKVEMDARKRADPRSALDRAMITLSGPPRLGRNSGACLWDGGPYTASSYPAGYPGQAGLESYPLHYHGPSAQYGTNGWMIHGGQGGSPYGFRGAHGGGRSAYTNQIGGWPSVDYGSGGGGAGPMRLSYQHRNWAPYGGGYGSHRGRGCNP